MKKYFFCLVFFSCLSVMSYAQSKITLQVPDHSDAEIYHNGFLVGRGSALIKLDNTQNRFTIKKEGYRDYTATFGKKDIQYLLKKGKTNIYEMDFDTRLVQVTTSPSDAGIYINGKMVGHRSYLLEIPKGKMFAVELKKAGYQSIKRDYKFMSGGVLPPIKDHLVLTNRTVNVTTVPSDVSLYVDNRLVGEGSVTLVIPSESCITLKGIKEGRVPKEHVLCNKSGDSHEAPLSMRMELKDYVVQLHSTPDNATIKIDGKVVGTGKFDVQINEGACVEVIVQSPGFISEEKIYCNKPNFRPNFSSDHIKLDVDEAYLSSSQIDQANKDITIDVSESRSNDDTWKLISMIVTSHFDILEVTDKETGYIRTSWVAQSFKDSTIRTRFIVKLSGINPIQYRVKIQSQQSPAAQVSVKNDHDFEDWDRVLNTHKDIISEIQSRLRN
ncbi:MAG: hypothetical protein ACFCUI_03105 [Bernardetiaceae bacterium]